MSARIFIVGLIVAFLSGACTAEVEKKPGAQAPAPAKVDVVTIESTELTQIRTFLGEVRNARSTVLAAGGSGTVLKADVREGDRVAPGDLLVQLDDGILRARLREVKAQVERTRVQLAQAERDVARLGALGKQGFHPSSEVEQAESRQSALAAQMAGEEAVQQRLREEISQMRIEAPFEGVVARRHAAPGQWLSTGEPAIEIASSGALEVHVRVPAEVMSLVDAATAVEVNKGEMKTSGHVAGMVGSLDRRTRTALLRVMPDGNPAWLREGDAVDASLRLTRQGDGVVVPTDALVQGVAGIRVMRVKDGKAEPHQVTVIAQFEAQALVSAKELAVGDSIVVRGNERLRPGQDVQVLP